MSVGYRWWHPLAPMLAAVTGCATPQAVAPAPPNIVGPGATNAAAETHATAQHNANTVESLIFGQGVPQAAPVVASFTSRPPPCVS